MKRDWIFIAVVAAVFALAYGLTFDSKLDTAGDSAAYIELARNMADGYGYSNIAPEGVRPTNFYPVGWPLLLSLLVGIGLDNLWTFKLLNALFMAGAIVLLYFVAKGAIKSRPIAFVTALLSAISPQLLRFAAMPMSETSYMFFSLLTIFALWRSTEDGRRFGVWFWLSVASAAFGYHIRTVGASVMLAVVVFYAFRREWSRAVVGGASMTVLLVPWWLRNRMLGLESRFLGTVMSVNPWRPEQGEIASVGEFVRKMLINFDDTVVKGFRQSLFPSWQGNYAEPSSVWGVIVGLAVLSVTVYGLWRIRPLRYALTAFVAANIALLMIWHGGNEYRYVTPLIPIIVLGFWNGIRSLVCKIPHRELRALPYAFLLAALFTVTPLKNLAAVSKRPYPPAYRNYFAIAEQMNDRLPPHSVVSCRKPELFHYFAPKILCVNYRYTLDDKELIRNLAERKVDWVVLEQLGYASTGRYLFPAIQKNPTLFRAVLKFENPDTYLLRFDREKAASADEK